MKKTNNHKRDSIRYRNLYVKTRALKDEYYFRIEKLEAELRSTEAELNLVCTVVRNYQAAGIKLQPFFGEQKHEKNK